MKNILWAALIGGIVFFLWGYVYWNVLPGSTWAYELSQHDARLVGFLQERFSVPSTQVSYLVDEERPVVATVFLQQASQFGTMAWQGLLHMIVGVAAIATALRMLPVIPAGYGARWLIVAAFGVAAAFVANFGDPIWFTQGWSWHLVQAGYDLSFWIIAGAVVAAFVKPAATRDDASPGSD